MTKLILHFDINGTLTAIDNTDQITKNHNINMLVSKSIFGDVLENEWIPSVYPFDEEKYISYYDYLKKKHPKMYKKYAYKFTEKNEPGEEFRHYYDKMIQQKNFIFSSFINVLTTFDCKLVLRTFGVDGKEVINNLRKLGYKKKFILGHFSRTKNNIYLKLGNRTVIVGYKNIHKFIKHSKYNLLLVDNYKYWNDNKKDPLCGKVVFKNKSKQLFFDDNYCCDVRTTKGVPKPNNNIFVKVNTLRAMIEPDYYVKIIKERFKLK